MEGLALNTRIEQLKSRGGSSVRYLCMAVHKNYFGCVCHSDSFCRYPHIVPIGHGMKQVGVFVANDQKNGPRNDLWEHEAVMGKGKLG